MTFAELKADSATVRIAADGYHVTTINIGMDNREAYTKLFAAAPNMLAALKAVSAGYPDSYSMGLAMELVKAAIAKAEG